MRIYAVGQIYPEFIRPGSTGARMDFEDTNLIKVIISDAAPTRQTVDVFKSVDRFQFGLHYYREQILLALKVGGFTWMDMIYQPHLAGVVSREAFLNCRPKGALGINIYYVDSNTGRLLGMQFITSSNELHAALIAAVQDKLHRSYDVEEDHRILGEVYEELPDPLAVAEAAEVGFAVGDLRKEISVKVNTGPAQSKEDATTKPCQTRDFSGRKEYRTDS